MTRVPDPYRRITYRRTAALSTALPPHPLPPYRPHFPASPPYRRFTLRCAQGRFYRRTAVSVAHVTAGGGAWFYRRLTQAEEMKASRA
jgi:hypothetical protein